jgi:hypothetical protein
LKRNFLLASDQIQLDAATKLLDEGWEFDPLYEGKPIRLEWSLVFPLILYESDLERDLAVAAQEKAAEKTGDLEDVESIVSVDINAADEKLRDGYRVLEAFAKTVTLVKRRQPEEKAVGVV